MTTTTAMKSAALKSAAVGPTSDARLPTGRKAPRHAAMIEPAERARTSPGLGAAMKARAPVESRAAAVEMVAIDERAAVRHVSVVVEVHPPVAPIGVPVVPSPTESAEEADPPTDSERNARADGIDSGVPGPARVSD